MNTSDHEPIRKTDTPGHADSNNPEFSLERIHRLIHDLEQELEHAEIPQAQAQELRTEIDTLKHMLTTPEEKQGRIRERLHGVHNTLQDVTATVEGEVLKDSPYIAEMGRILGLV